MGSELWRQVKVVWSWVSGDNGLVRMSVGIKDDGIYLYVDVFELECLMKMVGPDIGVFASSAAEPLLMRNGTDVDV